MADLLLATSHHYWGPKEDEAAETRRAAAALLDGRSDCHMLLGLLDGAAAAYATYAILHPAPTEHGTLFLKDLFVRQEYRGKKLGEALMRELAKCAVERGCFRFDWTAESDNPGAVAFYDMLTAERVTEKVYFRFSGEKLARFADGEGGD